jgi:hypothetical protein
MNDKINAINVRINILENRENPQNGNIIRKLRRQLRKLENK